MSKITNLKVILAVSVFLPAIVCTNSAGRTIYVDAQASGNNDGTYWVDAYNCLQDALTDAQAGDDIWVAEGIYNPDQGKGIKPGDRNATFKLKNGVSIYGGFPTGGGDWDDSDPSVCKTILSGDLNGDDVEVANPTDLLDEPTRAENSYHVVTGSRTTQTAVLDGFTITGGTKNGGGMYNQRGRPTIANCTFIENASHDRGGGMYNQDSSPTLTNCTFTKNSAEYGGAMRNWYSEAILTGCIFLQNSSLDGGGAVSSCYSSMKLTNCIFSGNSAGGEGGAIRNFYVQDKLVNCLFSGNSTQKNGGGIDNSQSNPTLINCTFSGNSAEYWGGGIYASGDEKNMPTLINCILWANTTEHCSQRAAQIYGHKMAVNNCCVQDLAEDLGGTGNIGLDPLFVNPGNGNYHLLADSPCIDSGDNTAVSSSAVTDLDGNPRIIGGNVDIGADEYGR